MYGAGLPEQPVEPAEQVEVQLAELGPGGVVERGEAGHSAARIRCTSYGQRAAYGTNATQWLPAATTRAESFSSAATRSSKRLPPVSCR